jgi:hypothetical protein
VNRFARVLITRGILKDNLDYHFIRACIRVLWISEMVELKNEPS